MKIKNNIIKGALLLAVGSMATSCASDYLDVAPETSISESTATSTEEGISASMTGLYQIMYNQYNSFSSGAYRNMNGEQWMNWFYGDVPGQDAFYMVWAGASLYLDLVVNANGMNVDNYWFCQPGWIYYYSLIGAANRIIGGLPSSELSPEAQMPYRAQALAMRAHAYTRLLMIYGPRWQDSDNGNVNCLVKRTPENASVQNAPMVSMNEIFDMIYADLNEAIELFETSKFNRGHARMVNAQVAKGLLARAAVVKQDWATAKQMAHEARQGFTIMSSEQVQEGFTYANQEWMWYMTPEPTDVYYCTGYAMTGCNGAYVEAWNDYGAGSINYDLYRQMDESDVRRNFFFTPDKINKEWAGQTAPKEEKWWDTRTVDANTMDMANASASAYKAAKFFATESPIAKNKPESWPKAYSNNTTKPGQNKIAIFFGSQMKFWAYSSYGTSDVCWMRAAEMLLLEAEAAYQTGDAATAQSCLNELVSKRVVGYSCTKTGQALLDEIRLQRRLELWGEGTSWFDLKRWNLPMERREWIRGDVNSNNIPSGAAITLDPSAHNGWRWVYPMNEYLYNDLVEKASVNVENNEVSVSPIK